MDVDDSGDFGFDQRGGNLVGFRSSGRYMPPESEQIVFGLEEAPPMAKPPSPPDVAEQFLDSNWNPFVSMDRYVDFNGSVAPSCYNVGIQENRGLGSTNGCSVEEITRLPFFNNGKIINPFALSDDDQIASSPIPTGFLSSDQLGKDSKGKKKRRAGCGAFDSLASFDRIQTGEAEHKKDVSPGSVKRTGEKDEKGERGEQIAAENAHKPASKQSKENSSSEDAPKKDYVHVRAKRGQSTNSHSLAERVRREKISQRMKLLQDLVPGCSKITGKAVMLDEIINYVQSLQQQVEFLSMKLATVYPELNLDVRQILSAEALHLRTRSPAVPGFDSSHWLLQRQIQQGITQVGTSSNVWDDGPQGARQMDVIPNAHVNACTKSPGYMKMEL